MKYLLIFGLLALVNWGFVVWMVYALADSPLFIFASLPFASGFMSSVAFISVANHLLGVRRGW